MTPVEVATKVTVTVAEPLEHEFIDVETVTLTAQSTVELALKVS